MSKEVLMLQLPTKWDMTTQEDQKKAELLGNEDYKVYADGYIYVNIYRIDGINDGSVKNTCVLRFGGDVFSINMPLQSLIRLLKENGVEFKSINNTVE